ncbi:Phosphoribosylamine-glycine ligase [gamma proteobacterium IMCC1989]|nr:Phosphoribosylamine-glycine ligase [gamma proteobacterium IMCC1989]
MNNNEKKTAIRFLIIDHQARGHALSCLLAQSNNVEFVFLSRESLLPRTSCNKVQPIYWIEKLQPDAYHTIVSFCHENEIDCVVIGTAHAMTKGLVDVLVLENIKVIGAGKNAAILEGSKSFSKQFFERHNVTTPKYYSCRSINELLAIDSVAYPCFIKSDSMIKSHYSAVKVSSREEAVNVAIEIFSIQKKRYGFSTYIILEELCRGRELSVTILMSGKDWVELPICRDYKTLSGKCDINTGGMGAITPVPDVGVKLRKSIVDELIRPVVAGMVQESLSYNGFLYFGIMIDTANMPVLLELNCRLGDPEGQAIFSLLTADFVSVLFAAATGRLQGNFPIAVKSGYICCVYAVPNGYPKQSDTSFPVLFSETFENTDKHNFYFGELLQSEQPNTIMTHNNRMFCVSARGETLFLARKLAYQKLDVIFCDGMYYRHDIGESVIEGVSVEYENI